MCMYLLPTYVLPLNKPHLFCRTESPLNSPSKTLQQQFAVDRKRELIDNLPYDIYTYIYIYVTVMTVLVTK